MMLNYMNMGLGQPDPSMIPQQGFAGPMGTDQLSLSNPGFKVGGPPVMRPYQPGQIDPTTGLPINPGTPLPGIAGPDASLTGWDGVHDKMRYFAQQMQQNRMMRHSMRDAQPGGISGRGGGGGGFGQLIHSLFGGGAGGSMGGMSGMTR
jgi:hypothetical protein